MQEAQFLILIPVIAAICGAAIASVAKPGPVLSSAIQHFAAGVVFAAAAAEILPSLKHENALWPTIMGGAVGIVVMLIIEEIGKRTTGRAATITLVGVDLFVDGLVLGLGFAANIKVGLLLTIALTLEILFLTLSLTLELVKEGSSRPTAFSTASFVVLLVPVGLFAADRVALLPQSTVTGFFAFSLIALLYLVTEELLAEAHETPDRPWVTALFFVGFLLLLALEDLIG